MVSYLLFTFTKKSMWEIAEVVNYKSHASVFRDKCNIPALIKTNKYFAKEMIPIIEKAKQIATDLVYVDEEVFDFYSESAFLQDRPGKLFTDNTMLNLAS